MSKQFKFTDPGEGLQEAEILEVHVSDGDTVSDGDVALTIETDKASTEIPAPFNGTVEQVQVAEGDTVEIGDVLMTYSEAGESGAKQSEASSGAQSRQESGGGEKASSKAQDGSKQAGQKTDQKSGGSQQTGDKQTSESESRASGESGASKAASRGDRDQPVPAAPSTRRLAREKGVDLHDVEPSGPEGRVTAEDVEAAAETSRSETKARAETSPLTPGVAPPELPDFSQWGEIEREPLRSIRRATAQNMARSWAQIPHVYHQDIADVTALERFRRKHEDSQALAGGKLTLTVLVMKALASTLVRFPRFNTSLDVVNEEIVYKNYCHMGLAVATERGLLVPVIRDVDRKNIVELAIETSDIARKARNGELSRTDMEGGSITVTNPGPLGGSSLTPLINHPQVAILGMGRAQLEPVVSGDLDAYRIEPRLRLPLVLGFDHRVNDGADAARFVSTLIETLADPESLLLAV